jgi:hypothetical protein
MASRIGRVGREAGTRISTCGAAVPSGCLSAFRDRPDLTADRASQIDETLSQRRGFCRQRVTFGAVLNRLWLARSVRRGIHDARMIPRAQLLENHMEWKDGTIQYMGVYRLGEVRSREVWRCHATPPFELPRVEIDITGVIHYILAES